MFWTKLLIFRNSIVFRKLILFNSNCSIEIGDHVVNLWVRVKFEGQCQGARKDVWFCSEFFGEISKFLNTVCYMLACKVSSRMWMILRWPISSGQKSVMLFFMSFQVNKQITKLHSVVLHDQIFIIAHIFNVFLFFLILLNKSRFLQNYPRQH